MDEWKAPRPHTTRRAYSIQLAVCFIATLLFLAILGLLSMAFGQEHPFPFKTLEEVISGTPAWLTTIPPQLPKYCPSGGSALITKYEYASGAGSVWAIWTDNTLFAAAYFPPGQDRPVAVAVGHITSTGQVIIDKNEAFVEGKQRPCDPWQQKGA